MWLTLSTLGDVQDTDTGLWSTVDAGNLGYTDLDVRDQPEFAGKFEHFVATCFFIGGLQKYSK